MLFPKPPHKENAATIASINILDLRVIVEISDQIGVDYLEINNRVAKLFLDIFRKILFVVSSEENSRLLPRLIAVDYVRLHPIVVLFLRDAHDLPNPNCMGLHTFLGPGLPDRLPDSHILTPLDEHMDDLPRLHYPQGRTPGRLADRKACSTQEIIRIGVYQIPGVSRLRVSCPGHGLLLLPGTGKAQ